MIAEDGKPLLVEFDQRFMPQLFSCLGESPGRYRSQGILTVHRLIKLVKFVAICPFSEVDET
jgi:hypothetical protein